ncbi:MAG: hypothetical protein K6B52_01450, partial [Clostridiales bacterium]|nr:hypothetical protein [Clostridiales bacterium]
MATAKFSDPKTATAAIKGYTEDTSSRSIESYLAAFNIAYKAGKADWSFGSNMLDAAKREIGASLAKTAFDLGSDELESARTNFNTEMPKEVGFHNLADLSAIKVNSQRKAVERQAYLMDGIAKLTGLSITLVDSGKVNGVNKNGLYRTGTNQIVIALNGSAVESNWITRTAGHETYHFIENFDKENGTKLAESLKDTVVAFYTEAKGEKWVNDHIAKTYANYSDNQRMS